ncbi:tRNA (N(6)-L-threonylcarbamoyladenosine(37)-C(2))-methylthiotransferase MtaB [candidate division KSB1 bacterium]|nr:tRNA (N(6)-L-threonylcarbamoyladenosine(37)-C(2))-methylthiotransferase MtaB [candidate division KSB1 bacterium]
MKKVSFHTFGCKLNQTETSFLENEFTKRGYRSVAIEEPADYVVINTCTVTARTDYKCRQLIRRVRKTSPDAKIVVVGCYAQMDPERLKSIPGVNLILGADRKFNIFDYLENGKPANGIIEETGDNEKFIDSTPELFSGKTRAFLKIQDGCNSFCSYCIVPYARGRSRSDLPENVIANVEKLVANGYREIVLTGVHIGKYGQDLQPSISLFTLLRQLLEIRGLGRIRLSSLEPKEIDDDLIDLIAKNEKICPHFHVPLQSGDDEILRKMRRHYSVTEYKNIIEKIVCRIPKVGLGTDVIVGFPGEMDRHFENTKKFIESIPFTYLHVFSFSDRPGTDAYNMREKIDASAKKERSALLIQIAGEKKAEFYRKAVGGYFDVLFEDEVPGRWMYGFTENYIRVRSAKKADLFNKIKQINVSSADNNFVLANVLD